MFSLSIRHPHKNPVICSLPLSHTYYMLRPSLSSWFDSPTIFG
jgi:hypothetical protein